MAAILRDITVLKNLEQMKDDFVNTVSHDLKSPITVIAGMADLMRMAGPGDPNHASRCQDIRDTAQHRPISSPTSSTSASKPVSTRPASRSSWRR